MRFALLGSGSRGNATLVEAGSTLIMVDCGFSVAETRSRLDRLQVGPDEITAILITHEHADHVNGVARFAARYGIPVHCTRGTLEACGRIGLVHAHCFAPHAAFALDGVEITPLTVPHDAREPTQFVFTDGRHKLGVLTDAGSITAHMQRLLDGCHALVLECNHDRELLESGPYPAALKHRVGGPLGHLSNAQAAELMLHLQAAHLQHLVAAHLSQQNNKPELARAALAHALNCKPDWIQVATQDSGLSWRELH